MEEENKEGEDGEGEQEVVVVDPKTLKPDLYAAAVANDLERVVALLADLVPPTYVEPKSGFTPLHWAAMHGNVSMLRKLIDGGASEPYHRMVEQEKKLKAQQNAPVSKSRTTDDPDDQGSTGEVVERGDNNEENQEEEEEDADKALEVSTNLLMNTPLLWAVSRGFLKIIWHLLAEGYSPNDKDNMGNNAVHLASAGGDLKIIKVIIDDGGNANMVNTYNLPIDMAKSKEVRVVLAQAMEMGASMTEEDVVAKHELNMKQFHRIANNLNNAVAEASRMNSPRNLKTLTVAGSNKLMNTLSEAITVGKEYALDEETVTEGEKLLAKLEVSQELIADIMALQKLVPVRSQHSFIECVQKLEKSIERAEAADIDRSQIQLARDLIARCQMEYFVSICLARLRDIAVADASNEHDMTRLRQAVQKAQSLHASEAVVDEALKLLGRWDAELGMSRAIAGMPVVKLPMENPPPGYYTEKDVGFIKQTEEYPNPPADSNGEYIWIPSESFTALQRAIERLKSSYIGSDSLGANPTIIAEAKEKLTKAEKDLKVLEVQNEKDKQAAIEVAKKLVKKLKKGKGKK